MTKSTSQSGSRLNRLDTFVLAGVITIFLTRAYLAVTGYPQIGNDSLHVAHVLWGGLLLTAAFLFILLANTPNKLFIALIGGVGFGLFIDEVGKFITQDNDYFYEPSIGIMYICFLLIWFISRLLIVRNENAPFLSPAEWPSKNWMRYLIIGWVTVQALAGVIVLGGVISGNLGSFAKWLSIPQVGILITLLYAIFLFYGLWSYARGDVLRAAHEMRGATIFGIVAVFPFLYLNHPELSTLVIIPSVLVVLGLSEVSVMSLLRKLLIR